MRQLARWIGGASGLAAVALAVGCAHDQVSGVTPPADAVTPGIPPGWHGVPRPSFTVGIDRGTRHGGAASAYFAAFSTSTATSTIIEQDLRADSYRGKRVRLSAWVQHTNLYGDSTGLFMVVEGGSAILAESYMSRAPLAGSADWHQISAVLDVAPNAVGIELGVLMSGSGILRVDDMHFDVVDAGVPSTNTLLTPRPTNEDSAAVADVYAAFGGTVPANLDFEGFTPPQQTTIDWLSANTSPLSTTDPQSSLADLAPLEAMVGGAHLVGLGEGTHGTREFFRMKHRIVEALVRDMGFTTFAIEATTAEANDMNRYVLTGEGNPNILLSRLYFWTWNTQEVLDMVQWMRSWNASAPPPQRVQFLGFDMQFPDESMDSVQALAAHIGSSDSAYVALRFNCMDPYRNRGPNSSDLYPAFYAGRPASERAACAAGLQEVYDLIATEITRTPSAASPATYQLRLHDARIVQQYEQKIGATGVTAVLSRDRSMAENIEWIRDQAGPAGKVVLWAHDGHINSVPGYMGGYLRAAYGADYVSLGFAFGTGSFNAVGLTSGGLTSWTSMFIPPNSIEAVFVGTGKPLLLFDTRRIPSGGAAAAPLSGPIPMRSIGSAFEDQADASFYSPISLPSTFDLLIYVQSTTASTLLPFVFQ